MLKGSKHEPTDSYFYPARKVDKCMVVLNSHIGCVRTKITSKNKMNNSKMISQKNPNLYFCSSDDI